MLVAASGLAKEVISSFHESRAYHVTGIVDDDQALTGTSILGVPVLGPLSSVAASRVKILICVGRGSTRQLIVNRLAADGLGEDRYGTWVDPSVRLSAGCHVGRGSILLANVVLTAAVTVGRHVVVMPNVTLTHDDVVEDFATICAGVSLGGGVTVGAGAYLGMNASVRENVSVGAGSVLGMGAVLLRDLPARQTWAGVPAGPLAAKKPSNLGTRTNLAAPRQSVGSHLRQESWPS